MNTTQDEKTTTFTVQVDEEEPINAEGRELTALCHQGGIVDAIKYMQNLGGKGLVDQCIQYIIDHQGPQS